MRIEEIRTGLAERLQARRAGIEQAALTRILHSVSDPGESSDPEYLEGLRTALRSGWMALFLA
jgi:hypothetical protein